ncbi:MAG: hypothetical protein LPK85_08425 [Gammaproteobacteria bacterium]|nr:hypothetical protein [Gammaproteobacteria bacterium]
MLRVALLSWLCLLAIVVRAEPLAPLPAPTGPVILTLDGELACCPQGVAQFDYAMLEALPQTEIRTGTPWTEGLHTYRGVRLKALLERVGAQGRTLEASALNDYIATFALDAAERYPVIIALTEDGARMPIRNKGPLWIVYPLTDHPELNREEHFHAMVWQLKAITVKP